jgi:hypothetical protein
MRTGEWPKYHVGVPGATDVMLDFHPLGAVLIDSKCSTMSGPEFGIFEKPGEVMERGMGKV